MADFNDSESNKRQRIIAGLKDFRSKNPYAWQKPIDLGKVLSNDMPGFSDAKENEGNVNISSNKSFVVNSLVRSYAVDEGNVGVLSRIFQENPDIDREFKFKYPYFQNVFMNEIAGHYHKLENNLEIFEEKDIIRMEQMVNDMELAGLKLKWLKDRLATVGETLRKDKLRSIDLEKVLLTDMPGSSEAKTNETSPNILSYKSFPVSSTVRIYNVDEGNVGVLSQIFQENPNIDIEFKFKYPYFQNVFMNEIAGSYCSLKNNSGILEVKDVVRMCQIVTDMELTGLNLTWLKDRLSTVRGTLRKRLQEQIDQASRQIDKASRQIDQASRQIDQASRQIDQAIRELTQVDKMYI